MFAYPKYFYTNKTYGVLYFCIKCDPIVYAYLKVIVKKIEILLILNQILTCISLSRFVTNIL